MARILVSAFSNIAFASKQHDTYVDGFIHSLKRNGNHVLSVVCNDFASVNCKNKLLKNINESTLLNKLKQFSPELIITFNNAFPCLGFITETSCPILLYPADGYDFFSFKDLIPKYLERYFFLFLNQDNYKTFKENIPSTKNSQYIKFNYCTDFYPIELQQDLPISFLGSVPNCTHDLASYFGNFSIRNAQVANEIKRNFMDELDRFKEAPYSDFNFAFPDKYPYMGPFTLETTAIYLITTKLRMEVLTALIDLGISIYGYSSFCNTLVYNYDIFRAFNFQPHVNAQEVLNLYNRSEISLNLPNARTKKGFSWRVPDILATNSALLTHYSPDLETLMKGYTKLPMYNSPMEARTLAQKLLRDDPWRRDIVQASQAMINEKGRFEHNFKELERNTGVSLYSASEGRIETLEQESSSLAFRKSSVRKFQREAIKILPYFIARKLLKQFYKAT